MHESADLTVVIPFYEAEEYSTGLTLLRVISALVGPTTPPCEVLCVDDNSSTNLRDVIETAGATYVQTSAPRSTPHVGRRALARAIGADLSCSDYLMFLDADILVGPKVLPAIRNSLHSNGRQSMVFVPRENLRSPDGKVAAPGRVTDTNGYSLTSLDGYTRATTIDYSHGQLPPVPLWSRQSSHCFALHRQLLQDVGGWDTAFEGWGEEDSELFYRLTKAGGNIQVLQDVTVKHVPHEIDHVANHASFRRNAHYFIKKHPEVARLRHAFYKTHGILS